MQPLVEHFERLLAVPLACRTDVPMGEVVRPRISVIVIEIHGVPTFVIPYKSIEAIHPIGSRLDGSFRIPRRLVWSLSVRQQPAETLLRSDR